MDKTQYNHIVVNETYWERDLLDLSKWIKEYLKPKSVYCKDRFQNINHPLVREGRAFWYDNNTICIGYKLKTNHSIIKPIFNQATQNIIKIYKKEIYSKKC